MSNQAPHAAAQRIAWSQLRAARGEVVTYSTGAASVEVTAVKTRPTATQDSLAENLAYESRDWDWLFDPDELVDADGVAIEPARGHTITTADGTVYRPQPRDAASAVWRWSDGLRTWRRVYTAEG